MIPKIKLYLISLLLGVVPLPIFYDLFSGDIIYDCPGDFQLVAPINIGSIIILFLLIGFSVRSILNQSMPKEMLIGIVSIVVFFLYYTFLGGETLRGLQMIIPLLFLSSLLTVGNGVNIGLPFFIPMILFSFAHILSFITSDYEGIQKYLVVGEFCVYQSLVTYPSVLSIFATISLFFIKGVAKYFIFMLVFFVSILSQRKLAMLDYFMISSILILFSHDFRLRIGVVFFALIFLSWILELGMFDRLFSSVDEGDLSSGRFEIQSSFFSELNFKDLMFGTNAIEKPGLHNFFLNIIYGMGLVGLFLYIFPLVFLFYKLLRKKLFYYGAQYLVIIIWIAISSAMINSSITQPYFISNFVLAILIVRNFSVKNTLS